MRSLCLPSHAKTVRRYASHSPDHPARGKPLDPGQRGAIALLSQTWGVLEVWMPFAQQGPEPLDAVVNVRLTAAEKARLKEDADLAGVSMSELVRRRYFGRPLIAHADAVMIKELRRIGGLLKHLHNESQGAYSQETAAALTALKRYIEQLSAERAS